MFHWHPINELSQSRCADGVPSKVPKAAIIL